jgi:hypothetical protein
MGYLLLGAILLIVSIGALWFSLPVDGQMRFARQGRDVWIAIAITTGVGIGSAPLLSASPRTLINSAPQLVIANSRLRTGYFWVWARFRSFSCCIGRTRCWQVFCGPGVFA